MTKSIRHAVFDLDATLYPADSGIWIEIKSRINLYMLEHMLIPQAEVVGLRHRYLTQFGTTLAGLQHDYPDMDSDGYLDFVHDVSYERYLAPNPLLDQMLAELPITKSIFTNADSIHAERVLSLLSIRRHFTTLVDIRKTNFINKPDPRAFSILLDSIRAEPEECIMIDDSVRNLDTAQSLRMSTLLICPDHVPKGKFAHQKVPDILSADGPIRRLCNLRT